MEHDVVVCSISIVVMRIPVTGALMNLYISHPECSVDFDLCIEEVGSCVPIWESTVVLVVGRCGVSKRNAVIAPFLVAFFAQTKVV